MPPKKDNKKPQFGGIKELKSVDEIEEEQYDTSSQDTDIDSNQTDSLSEYSEEETEGETEIEEPEEPEETEEEPEETEEESEESEIEDETSEKEEETEMGDEDCMYRFSNKKNKKYDIDDANLDDDYFDEYEPEQNMGDKYVAKEERITKPVLTKYERVRAIGIRARQLASGAKPTIKDSSHLDPKTIAKLELENKVMPYYIEREMPSGKIERWHINELQILN